MPQTYREEVVVKDRTVVVTVMPNQLPVLLRVIVTMVSFAVGLALSFYVMVGYKLLFLQITPRKLVLAGVTAFILEGIVAWNMMYFWMMDDDTRNALTRNGREDSSNSDRDNESESMHGRAKAASDESPEE